MSKTSWLLSVLTLAAVVNHMPAQAQLPAEPAAPAAPAVTTAPAVNLVESAAATATPRGSGLIADVGFMVLTPTWRDNPAYATRVVFTANQTNTTQTDFDFGYNVAPKVTLGWIGSGGLGLRTNWWSYARASSLSTAVPANQPAGTNGITVLTPDPLGTSIQATAGFGEFSVAGNFNAKLRMNVWDWEAVQEIQVGRVELLLSAGIRYAHIAQDYQAVLNITPMFGGGSGIDALVSGHNFNGAGPTLAVDGRSFIGPTNFYVYGNARGSLLFGRTRQSVARNVTNIEDPVFISTSNSDKTNLPVLEGGVGAGWGRCFGRRLIFAEAGVVGQVWFGAGNSARAGVPINGGSITDDNLGLIGYTFRFGVNY